MEILLSENNGTLFYPIPEDYFTEFKELSELENTYTLDQIDYKKIAEIETEFPYDFTEVKELFENYD